jgi:hypothetical protein
LVTHQISQRALVELTCAGVGTRAALSPPLADVTTIKLLMQRVELRVDVD